MIDRQILTTPQHINASTLTCLHTHTNFLKWEDSHAPSSLHLHSHFAFMQQYWVCAGCFQHILEKTSVKCSLFITKHNWEHQTVRSVYMLKLNSIKNWSNFYINEPMFMPFMKNTYKIFSYNTYHTRIFHINKNLHSFSKDDFQPLRLCYRWWVATPM